MSKRILVVEDNEKNLKLFSVIVSSLGYETLNAYDGEQGVAMAKEDRPDLVLMDIQMPKMDGVTALQKLKADEKTRDIPVIALTSYAMKGDRERLLAEGFFDYISKPINKDNFVAAVQRALAGPLAKQARL